MVFDLSKTKCTLVKTKSYRHRTNLLKFIDLFNNFFTHLYEPEFLYTVKKPMVITRAPQRSFSIQCSWIDEQLILYLKCVCRLFSCITFVVFTPVVVWFTGAAHHLGQSVLSCKLMVLYAYTFSVPLLLQL